MSSKSPHFGEWRAVQVANPVSFMMKAHYRFSYLVVMLLAVEITVT